MKKAFFVIDEPECCAECPMYFRAEQMHTGDFTYKQLFRCKIEPEGIEDCYLQDILHKKPDWCPLKSVENVLERLEEKKIFYNTNLESDQLVRYGIIVAKNIIYEGMG